MTTLVTTAAAASRLPADFAQFALALARRAAVAWSAWKTWHAVRRDRERLAAMDDRMLKDIGLTRHEVAYAVRFGRCGD